LEAQQQDEVLRSFDVAPLLAASIPSAAGVPRFFVVRCVNIRLLDSDRPGFWRYHDGVGWKVIGREREHMFQAPSGTTTRIMPVAPTEKEATRNDGRPASLQDFDEVDFVIIGLAPPGHPGQGTSTNGFRVVVLEQVLT